jgi:hypothetical protein
LILLFALSYTLLCSSKFMTDEQSKHQDKLSIRELFARFSIGAIMGGAIPTERRSGARSHSAIGYILPAILKDGQKQQQNSALPGVYYLHLVVV